MENLHDYSNYVSAAYLVSGIVASALATFTLAKYFLVKSKIKNEKSA